MARSYRLAHRDPHVGRVGDVCLRVPLSLGVEPRAHGRDHLHRDRGRGGRRAHPRPPAPFAGHGRASRRGARAGPTLRPRRATRRHRVTTSPGWPSRRRDSRCSSRCCSVPASCCRASRGSSSASRGRRRDPGSSGACPSSSTRSRSRRSRSSGSTELPDERCAARACSRRVAPSREADRHRRGDRRARRGRHRRSACSSPRTNPTRSSRGARARSCSACRPSRRSRSVKVRRASGRCACCARTSTGSSGSTRTPTATSVYVVKPALGEHSRRRIVGCLEDATIERVLGDVKEVRTRPPS